jgi:hypothetical protein
MTRTGGPMEHGTNASKGEESEGAHHKINRKTAGKEGIPLLDSSVLFILTSSNEMYVFYLGLAVIHYLKRGTYASPQFGTTPVFLQTLCGGAAGSTIYIVPVSLLYRQNFSNDPTCNLKNFYIHDFQCGRTDIYNRVIRVGKNTRLLYPVVLKFYSELVLALSNTSKYGNKHHQSTHPATVLQKVHLIKLFNYPSCGRFH